jgi:CRP/FNR family transcriptional regulator
VYVVEAGFFKTVTLAEDGAVQVTGFPMSGDLLGMDGLGPGIHRSDAVALTQATVCVLPRAGLLHACAEHEALARRVFGAFSAELDADHRAMLLLGSRTAEERVAAFVVETGERLAARGYAASDVGLWMTREDIGSFLGLELETISRVLGRLQRRGLLDVHRRHLHIVDGDALRRLVARDDEPPVTVAARGTR